MAHILDGRVKELTEDVDREKAAQEMVVKTAKEKIKAADSAKKKVAATKKAKSLAEKRSAELLAKQNETGLKLAEAISLNTAHVEELADLRATLEASEEKWYNEGFVDVENSAEPIVNQARRHLYSSIRLMSCLISSGGLFVKDSHSSESLSSPILKVLAAIFSLPPQISLYSSQYRLA